MDNVFRFANPEFLYGFFLIPILIIVFILALKLRISALKRFGNKEVMSILMPDVSIGRLIFKFILINIALSMIILGLARPQVGSKLSEIKREGVEIIIALDVSNSMMAEDIRPNRLERSKMAISRLIDRLNNDRIGLIVFAGDAFVQLPITTDYVSAKLFLNAISTDIVPVQGTSIKSAIDLAVRSFSPVADSDKALIIISDGEDHEENALQTASNAAENGIVIHTIGMGSPQGAPIPLPGYYGQKNFRQNRNGNVVISKLNENMLRQLSSAGDGVYVRADNSRSGLNIILDEINKMEKTEFEAKIFTDYNDMFQYPIAFALFILLLDLLVMEKKNKWLSRIKLFNPKYT